MPISTGCVFARIKLNLARKIEKSTEKLSILHWSRINEKIVEIYQSAFLDQSRGRNSIRAEMLSSNLKIKLGAALNLDQYSGWTRKI